MMFELMNFLNNNMLLIGQMRVDQSDLSLMGKIFGDERHLQSPERTTLYERKEQSDFCYINL